MATTQAYVVTGAQGDRPDIAGQIRVVGSTIYLTDAQAQFELSRGTIVLAGSGSSGSGGSSASGSGTSAAVGQVQTYQISAVSSFTATHAFPYSPKAWLIDGSGAEVETDVTYLPQQVVVTFPQPFTGTLLLG